MTTTAARSHDLGALTGLVCAVAFIGGLVLIGLLVPESAPPNLPSSAPVDVQRYFLENADAARAQALIQTVAAALLATFAASMAGLVGRTEPRPSGLAAVTVGGGMLAAAFLALSALLAATLGAEQITDSPATVSALRQLSFFVGGAGHTAWLGLFVGAASVAMRRAAMLPRWLTTAGLVSATLSLLSLLSLVVEPAALLIPLGRFSGLLVIAVISVQMATGHTGHARSSGSAGTSVLAGIGVVVLAFAITILI